MMPSSLFSDDEDVSLGSEVKHSTSLEPYIAGCSFKSLQTSSFLLEKDGTDRILALQAVVTSLSASFRPLQLKLLQPHV